MRKSACVQAGAANVLLYMLYLYFNLAFRGGFINQWQGTPDDIDAVQARRLMRQTQGLESEVAN